MSALTALPALLRWPAVSGLPRLDQLIDYYAPDSDRCGACFLDGTECEHPYVVVAGDLHAVAMLGLRIGPAASRRLLDESVHTARVGGCLASLPPDATLAEAGATTLDAMLDLHGAVLAVVDPRAKPGAASEVLATAVCARKRPELFPVLSPRYCRLLGLPGAADPQASWKAVRDILADERAARSIADLYAQARRQCPQHQFDIYPLRRLQVLTELV